METPVGEYSEMSAFFCWRRSVYAGRRLLQGVLFGGVLEKVLLAAVRGRYFEGVF